MPCDADTPQQGDDYLVSTPEEEEVFEALTRKQEGLRGTIPSVPHDYPFKTKNKGLGGSDF